MATQEAPLLPPLAAVRVGSRKLASRTGQPVRYTYTPKAIHLGKLGPCGAFPGKTLCGITLTEENADRDGRWADKDDHLPLCSICAKSRDRMENPRPRRRYPETRDSKKRWRDRRAAEKRGHAEERRQQKERLTRIKAFQRAVEAAEKEGTSIPQLRVERRVSDGVFCYAVTTEGSGVPLREFSGPRQKYPLAECLYFCSVWAGETDWDTVLEDFFREEVGSLPLRDQAEVLDITLEWDT